MTITEFLLARITEDEAAAREENDFNRPHGGGCGFYYPEHMNPECDCGYAARVLAECEAKRRIVALHEGWPVLVTTPPTFVPGPLTDVNAMTFRASQQIAWATEQEYRAKFGIEPPTAPMLLVLAAVYADHPDFDEAWR